MSDHSFDVREFIARVESANVEELTKLLADPNKDEEKALRLYLGDQRYQHMHDLAMMQRMRSRSGTMPSKRKGNVVVIHGIMGGQLSVINPKSAMDLLWVSYWRLLVWGWINRLLLDEDGLIGEYDVRATGIMKKYYGELVLKLNERWTTRAFWYDWRKDLNVAADELNAQISNLFGDDTPVHIVAHSMGGLVARTFIKRHPKRWEKMWDKESDGRLGGRLVMLGTPNHGSFDIPQIITGLEPTVKKLARFDLRNGMAEVLKVVNSFIGPYQMMPSPLVNKKFEKLYQSETYGDLNIPQKVLNNARNHHKYLKDVVDTKRMIYVAGDNRLTFSGIQQGKPLDSFDSYDVTKNGDGRVTHELGLLKNAAGNPIKTYYIEESHGDLPRNATILSAIEELLETGETTNKKLKNQSVVTGGTRTTRANKTVMRQQLIKALEDDEKSFEKMAYRLRGADTAFREPGRGAALDSGNGYLVEEINAEESLIRGFLGSDQEQPPDDDSRERNDDTVEIEIGLVLSDIGGVQKNYKPKREGPPIDAIAVGHYLGVRPQDAEKALDQAISRDLPGRVKRGKIVTEADLLLTQYTDRGIIRGELGQPFFLDDPRKTGSGGSTHRIIAVAGMGMPGRFGVPELTVTARELCWSLGRLGKKHLATVLIGAGNGNLSVRDSIAGWMRGIRHALAGSPQDEKRRLARVTFVEIDPRRIEDIEDAIIAVRDKPDNGGLTINYTERTKDELKKLKLEITRANRRKRSKKPQSPDEELKSTIPTRITVEVSEGKYRFAAITQNASIPERDVPLDQLLVTQANDEIAAEWKPARQLERGRFMEKLIIPEDFRPAMSSNSPLVMMLDADTARIHWEALAQSDPVPIPNKSGKVEYQDYFLGTSRGFTRQLRTAFGPPPEPPPPPRRVLRVLVVADPAANDPLPGAKEEGLEVAELFKSFNKVWNLPNNRVEVVQLSGPREATRTNVLRELLLRSYDVLHYAGHCFYNAANPSASGWVFGENEYLTANELNRIDRVPKFVFSNACESGITPQRSENRSVDLAPSFAEAFFKRGVSNFVCTAWPVDDVAASQFAITLYSNLLGLSEIEGQPNSYEKASDDPAHMHAAMRQARLAIADTPNGIRTWGAYQHYGNPYLRFFDAETLKSEKGEGA
jgi:hypothetical protein